MVVPVIIMSDISKRLFQEITSKGYSYGDMAKLTGIPKSAIQRYATGETEKIPLNRLEKMASVLNISTGYLMGWEEKFKLKDNIQFFAAREIDTIYDTLNADGQTELSRYGRYLTTLDEYKRPEKAPVVDLIPFYMVPAAAGYASPIEGEDYEMIPRPDDCPPQADFCVRITGDSMEPHIHDGQRVYVKRGVPLQDFDVGIFFVAGDVFCKQYCPGYAGQLYLLSANPKRQDANVILGPEDARGCTCFGKVLMKRIPKPSYM